MKQPDEFDAFYKSARTRLLLQTYALTGDLPASRSAVRDSFVVTWHHWRKVSRLPDPESWVRPHAWAQAQRRHTARIWHRDRNLDPEAARTLESLGKLSLGQRKALLLEVLTTLPLAERARELGLTRQRGRAADPYRGRAVRRAARGRPARIPPAVRDAARPGRGLHVAAQPRSCGGPARPGAVRTPSSARWPGSPRWSAPASWSTAPTVRRGSRRPTSAPAARSTPSRRSPRSSTPTPWWAKTSSAWRSTGPAGAPPAPATTARATAWPPPARSSATPTRGPAPPWSAPSPPAPPRASRACRRSRPPSCPTTSRRRGGRGTSRWPGTPAAPPRRSSSGRRCGSPSVGDEAMLVQLRDWSRGRTYLAGVARTGRITTTTFFRTDDNAGPTWPAPPGCWSWPSTACARPRRATVRHHPADRGGRPGPGRRGPGPARQRRPADGAGGGTARGSAPRPARRATTSPPPPATAPTSRSKPVRNGVTRTFLIPDARLPAAFGVTETAGTLPSERRRATFVPTVRRKMGSCADRDLGADVTPLGSASDKRR